MKYCEVDYSCLMLSLDFFLCFEVLLEAVDLLKPGDAVDGKLICEPKSLDEKSPTCRCAFLRNALGLGILKHLLMPLDAIDFLKHVYQIIDQDWSG